MKQIAKSIFAYIMSVIMVTSVLPVVAVNAAAADNIVINGVDIGYAAGEFFTKNGESCADNNNYNSAGEACASCHKRGDGFDCTYTTDTSCNCMRYWPTGLASTCKVDLGASQCFGYARYCQWIVYGKYDSQDTDLYEDLTGAISNVSGATLKAKLKNCSPATHVRTYNNGHSISIVSADDSGVVVTDCNNSSRDCHIEVRDLTWDEFATELNSRSGILYAYSYKSGSTETPDTPVVSDTWYQDYNPNYNSAITPDLIKAFLESYPNGGLTKTKLVDGQMMLDVLDEPHNLGFDNYFSYSNTVENENINNKESAQTLTPAQIIYYACVENDMNVVWMLAKMQDEQSLIGTIQNDDDMSYQDHLNCAVGYLSNYGAGEKNCGFIGQVISSTYVFKQDVLAGKTQQEIYEEYTPNAGSNTPYDEFMSDYYDVYAAWFDENMSDTDSGTDTPTYLDTPVITSPSASDTYAAGDSITFSWNAVDGADYYVIGVKDLTNGITLTAETLGTVSDEDNQIEDTFCTLDGAYVLSGHELKFAVGACSDDGLLSADWSSVTTVIETTVLPDVTYYTITYDANGGTDAPAADSKLEDVGINLNGVGPTREGYTCIGWSTDPDAVEAEYALGEVYDVNADITLYAVWQANTVVEPDEPETDTDYGTVIDSGTCGDNLTWKMYDSGTLVISGEGAMASLSSNAYPWYSYIGKIVKIVIENGVTSIGNNAFENCNALASVDMGKSIATLGSYAFDGCTALTTITVPDALTNIGFRALNNTTIRKVLVPESVVSIHLDILNYLTITSFVADNEDTVGYYTIDGILYHYNEYTDVTTLVRCPEAKTVRSFTVPEDVDVIGQSAFQYNDSLASITFHDNITSIGASAFTDCDALTNIVIPEWVTSIGNNAFENCNALASVDMGKSVTTLGSYAFDGCTALTTMYFYGNAPTSVSFRALNNVPSDCIIYYIEGTTGWTNPWNGFTTETFVPEDTTVSVIGVTLNKSTATMTVGSTLTLTATVTPADATNPSATWTSSNTAVAKVSGGKVTAVSAGTAVITVTTTDGGYTASCTVTVTEQQSAEDSEVVFTIGDVTGKPGDIIEVEVSVESAAVINSIALHQLTYDTSVLTFVGFTDYEEIESKCIFTGGFDEVNKVISLALSSKEQLNGKICKIKFQISESAEDGATVVQMASVVKCDATSITSEVESGTVTILTQLLGDISGDNVVDISDALRLFQHSMLPEVYPIPYVGNLDFNKDGAVDINDALRLFQYSMLPDIYPIG